MRERPILFSAPMVRALLAGTKTQTRRVAKAIPWREGANQNFSQARSFSNAGEFRVAGAEELTTGFRCPHGEVGDRLWVKETWRPHVAHGCALDACDCADVNVEYAADGAVEYFDDYKINRASPDWCMPKAADRGNVSPLFMPRWASRLVLEITDVRIERLHAIREQDATAEGVSISEMCQMKVDPRSPMASEAFVFRDNLDMFRMLWEVINGPGSWNLNPWVWALTFRRVTP